jgi:NAD(P)-dependent dehydrogenase (short-subunit alcohol dehydrogenase family)
MTDRSVPRNQPLALVVGACGGMGMACARRLGQRYRLVLADIDAAQLQSVAGQLAEEGLATRPVSCDVTDDVSVAALMQAVAQEGPLSALAHVVGLSPGAGDWRRIMAVNLPGAARMAQAALPLMQRGAAVFVSSLAGHSGGDLSRLHPLLDQPLAPDFLDRLESALNGPLNPTQSYTLSKYSLNRMVRRLAYEWGSAGNRIVSLSPGLIATPMGEREFTASPQKWDLLKQTPLQRQGSLSEIADALEFLVSDRASFITGTDLLVDGGIFAALSSK